MKVLFWILVPVLLLGLPGYFWFSVKSEVAACEAAYEAVQVGDPKEMLPDMFPDMKMVQRKIGEDSELWANEMKLERDDKGTVGDTIFRLKGLPDTIIWQFTHDADSRVTGKFRRIE